MPPSATVQFGALQVTPRVCYTRPPTTSNTDAFIEVDEVTLGEVKRIFTGWVFAASPGLHAVDVRSTTSGSPTAKSGGRSHRAREAAPPPVTPRSRRHRRGAQPPSPVRRGADRIQPLCGDLTARIHPAMTAAP